MTLKGLSGSRYNLRASHCASRGSHSLSGQSDNLGPHVQVILWNDSTSLPKRNTRCVINGTKRNLRDKIQILLDIF